MKMNGKESFDGTSLTQGDIGYLDKEKFFNF